jgi:glycerophosphoryl diester phosphodiesterase
MNDCKSKSELGGSPFSIWALACLVALWSAMPIRALEIIAHRGASHDVPENTLSAIIAGYEQGADACELDVHLTQDGKIIVMHDADTYRTAGVSNRIAESRWNALKKLDVSGWGKWKGKGFSEPAPLLEDVLPWIPERKRLFIEIKCGQEILAELKRVIRESNQKADKLVVIGFDYETVRASKRELPELEVYWLVSANKKNPRSPTAQELADKARAAGLDGLDLQHTFPIDQAFVATIHAAGLKLFTWTVDDPEAARIEKEAGVDGITTNRPRWLSRQLLD